MKKKFLFVIAAICSIVCLSSGLFACDFTETKVPHTHVYTDEIIAPTCTEQGCTKHVCKCGDGYEDNYVVALGHTVATDAAVAPTCTTTGLTEGERCSVCGTTLKKQTVIPVLGHDFSNYTYNDDATCTKDGTETTVCSREGCEETDTRTKENSVLGHEFTNYKSDGNATCTADGTKTAKCNHTGCEETKTIADEDSKLGHDYGAWVSNGDGTHTKTCSHDSTHTVTEKCNGGATTCTEQATCKDCGEKYGDVLGHEFTNYKSDGNATCEQDGTKTAKCNHTGCNKTDTVVEEGSKVKHVVNGRGYCSLCDAHVETKELSDRILVIESKEGMSETFVEMVNADGKYKIAIKHIEADDMPKTVDELCNYDQVVLNNISNDDLVNRCQIENFDKMLDKYVKKYGGGLFTIGGGEADNSEIAHAYNHEDMNGSIYQQMLPVQAVNYNPPVGVVFCLDTSGSMSKYLTMMKDGVTGGLYALTERDYMGIVTFDTFAEAILEMTPRIKETTIREAIDSISSANGNTQLTDSITLAGQMLNNLKAVDKRHIVIMTDGLLGDTQSVLDIVTNLHDKSGITVSVVGIAMGDGTGSGYTTAKKVADAGEGRVVLTAAIEDLTKAMRSELNAPELREFKQETFYPIVVNVLSPLVFDLAQRTTDDKYTLSVTLDGFYGVKVRAEADLILSGEYNVPIYAQWKYGEGMVGSFMCDLSGVWSSKFIADKNGCAFVKNVVDNLMPVD